MIHLQSVKLRVLKPISKLFSPLPLSCSPGHIPKLFLLHYPGFLLSFLLLILLKIWYSFSPCNVWRGSKIIGGGVRRWMDGFIRVSCSVCDGVREKAFLVSKFFWCHSGRSSSFKRAVINVVLERCSGRCKVLLGLKLFLFLGGRT